MTSRDLLGHQADRVLERHRETPPEPVRLEAARLDHDVRLEDHLRQVEAPEPMGPASLDVSPPLRGLVVQDDDLEAQLLREGEDPQSLQDFAGISHAASFGQSDLARSGLLEQRDYGPESVRVSGGRKGIGAVEIGLEGHALAGKVAQAGILEQASDGRVSVRGADQKDLRSVFRTHGTTLPSCDAASPSTSCEWRYPTHCRGSRRRSGGVMPRGGQCSPSRKRRGNTQNLVTEPVISGGVNPSAAGPGGNQARG